jgi:hypothetical protein
MYRMGAGSDEVEWSGEREQEQEQAHDQEVEGEWGPPGSPLFSRPTVPRPANIDDFENLPVPTAVPERTEPSQQ